VNYRFEPVVRIPEQLEDGVIYVSDEYEIAALKCACGCGHKVTLLLGDGHDVRNLGGHADVSPSIGVWDAPCRSHFFVKHGNVRWAERWSDEKIRAAMGRQLSRHVERTTLRQPWYARAWKWLRKLWS